jgi:hypothetical protein
VLGVERWGPGPLEHVVYPCYITITRTPSFLANPSKQALQSCLSWRRACTRAHTAIA